jgi:ketosteroid isomerase-like protein
MRRILLVFAGVAVLSLTLIAQAGDKEVAEEVIAITKAEWADWMKKDVTAQYKNVADDYTEFNADYPTRLDGKAMIVRLNEAFNSGSGAVVAAEMANEKVQVYGDVAILSYNFIGSTRDKDGTIQPSLAKSTRVYVKQGGQWMLVHANFAPVGD